jgi:hypothetical protein
MPGKQLLIQWTCVGTDLLTWEDEQEVTATFPLVMSWGQAGLKGRGDVTVLMEPVPKRVSDMLHDLVERDAKNRLKQMRPQDQPCNQGATTTSAGPNEKKRGGKETSAMYPR